MEVEIRIRITNDDGKYLENLSKYTNKRMDSLKNLLLRTTLAQLPGEVEELFSEAESEDTVWQSDKVEEEKPAKAKPTKGKPTAAKK